MTLRPLNPIYADVCNSGAANTLCTGARTAFQFASMTGRNISDYSDHGVNGNVQNTTKEDEVLLLPGACFRIEANGITEHAKYGVTEVRAQQEDAAAEGMLSHQQRKKPYVNLYGDGTAIGGGAIEYATAVDGVDGDGQELYHDVQVEQQRSAIESALYDGAKDAAASAATSSTAPPAIPLLPPKSPAVPPKETQPQTQLRCKKCKAKIQFCVCNVRRDSSAIIGKSNQQLQSGDPGKTCTYRRGACRSMQTPGPGPYCRQHTCAQCGKAKRSGDPACKQCAAGSDV